MGMSIAYYLSERDVTSTVIERNQVAGAASGKAAGFLAMDWNDDTPSAALSRLSFQLHKTLAEKFGDRTDFRFVSALGVATAATARQQSKRDLPSWLDGNILGSQVTQ